MHCPKIVRFSVLAFSLLLNFGESISQTNIIPSQDDPVYKSTWKLDLPLMLGGIGVGVTGYLTEHKLNPVDQAELGTLDRMTISGFNRGAAYNWSPSAARVSDVMLLSSVLSPLGMILVPKRSGEWGTIGIMAAEAFFYTYGITSGTKGTVRRLRPFAYNPLVPQETRLDPDARAGFPSGHASHTALACFFGAKIYSDLYPERRSRYFVWAGAALYTGTVAWLRVRAGKHFPTDVIAGSALGAGIGVLIPHLHKKERKYFSLAPLPGGLQLAWRF